MSIQNLYAKVADFEGRLPTQSRKASQCKAGCSRCCYTEIGVFPVEADNIRTWFKKLSHDQKKFVQQKWNRPESTALSFSGESAKSCAFLKDEKCTIYEARPLICRTQGLAFMHKDEEKKYIDICPLNEEVLLTLDETGVINLELLNTILVQLNQLHEKKEPTNRVMLTDLKDELMGSRLGSL